MSQTLIGVNQKNIVSNRASSNGKIKLSTSSMKSSQKYPKQTNFNPEQNSEVSSDGVSDQQPIEVVSNAGRRRPTEDWENAWSNERGG